MNILIILDTVTPEVYMIAPFTLAYQLKKENLVEVHDWVHNVDSSTIYGTVIGFIEQEFEKYGGLVIPKIHTDGTRSGLSAIAEYDDYIILHPKVGFVVMRPETYRYLIL